MEIIQREEPIFISDYETFLLLEEKRKESTLEKINQEALTIEYETFAYLSDRELSQVSDIKSSQHFEELLSFLSGLKLTKLERLEIINSLPKNMIDFYILIEECEERYENRIIEEDILPRISKALTL